MVLLQLVLNTSTQVYNEQYDGGGRYSMTVMISSGGGNEMDRGGGGMSMPADGGGSRAGETRARNSVTFG